MQTAAAQKTLSLDALNIPDKSTLSLRSTQNDLLHFSGRNVQMNEALPRSPRRCTFRPIGDSNG
ncbi:MAG: hypothetical protein ACLTXT_03365 [Ruminococcus callidus]